MLMLDTFWMAGPPGNPRPSTRAALSKASPAASSLVRPTRMKRPWPSMRIKSVCPPEAIRHSKGKPGVKLGVSTFEPRGVDMPFQVVKPNKGQVVSQRQALGGVDSYDQ